VKYFSSDFASSSGFRVGNGSWTFQSALLEYARMWVRGAGSVPGTCSNTVQCVVRHSGTDGHAIMYEPHNTICFYVTVQYNALQCSAVQKLRSCI
jgi:hypothetical protein